MSETTTDEMRSLLIQQYPSGEAVRVAADFDAWHRKELAKAWEEGAESATYDPYIRGFVTYPDNPYEEAP